MDSVSPGLPSHRILQFKRGDWNPIDGQDYINTLLVFGAEVGLPRDSQNVGVIETLGLWVHSRRRGEVGGVDQFPIALEAVAKDIEAALVFGVQRPHQVFDQDRALCCSCEC